MSVPLAGARALVTGGGSGIGLGCARALLADGAHVTIAGRDATRLASAARALTGDAAVGEIDWLPCDVTVEADVVAAVERAASPDGRLDIVVASSGAPAFSPIVRQALDNWRAVLDVNLTGVFLTIKHAGSRMAAGGGGAIVAVSSIAAALVFRWAAAYGVSKAGVDALVRAAADELARGKVRVNAVRPGLVPTDMVSDITSSADGLARYLDRIPLGRAGTVEEIAAAVRFLAGPESSWITGQSLAVDGGHTLRSGVGFDDVASRLFGPEVLDGLVPGAVR